MNRRTGNADNLGARVSSLLEGAAGQILAASFVASVGALVGAGYTLARIDERVIAIERVDATNSAAIIDNEREIHRLQRDCATTRRHLEGRVSWLEALAARKHSPSDPLQEPDR